MPSDLGAYANILRAENNLAHSTTEIPPKAALDKSAYSVAVARELGIVPTKTISVEGWEPLIQAMGDTQLWSAYYLCLADVPKSSGSKSFADIAGFAVPRKEVAAALASPQTDGNAVSEIVAADTVNRCLGLGLPRPSTVALPFEGAVLVKAMATSWGVTQGVVIHARLQTQDLAAAAELIASQGCSDWNQALAWAVRSLAPQEWGVPAMAGLVRCADSRTVQMNDPGALYASLRFGMSTDQARSIWSANTLQDFLETEWTPAGPSSSPVGLGTLSNSISLVSLLRTKGVSLPSWLKDGAMAHAKTLQRDSSSAEEQAATSLLCIETGADCTSYVEWWSARQSGLVTRVSTGQVSDVAGAVAVQALVEQGRAGADLGCGDVKVAQTLYDKAPQTFAQLAGVDKRCWMDIQPSDAELRARIQNEIGSGNFENAEALGLYLLLSRDNPVVSKDFKNQTLETIGALVSQAKAQNGADFLTRARPLRLVLLVTIVESW